MANLSTNVSSGLPTSVDVTYLPGEILQTIFSNLDGHSLTVCKKVCKTWRDHAKYLTQRPNYWENRCLDEIPQYALVDLLNNMFPNHNSDECKISVDWFEVYKSWFNWRVFHSSENVSVVKMASELNITQIKVSGKLLLASSCSPVRLVAYRLIDDTWSEEKLKLHMGGNRILDFELVDRDVAVKTNLQPNEEREKVFSLMAHNEIWIETITDYFQLGKDYQYQINRNRQAIAHSHGYEMILLKPRNLYRQDIDIVETSLNFKKISKGVSGPDNMNYRYRMVNPYSEIMQFWGNKVCLGRLISHCERLEITTMIIDMDHQELIDMESETFSVKAYFTQLVCWQATVFFEFSTERDFFKSFYSGHWRFVETSSKEGCISCCHVYNEYLFLGTDTGLLLVYFLEKPVMGESHPAVFSIIPFETPAKQIRLPYFCPIKAISVAESTHHGSRFPKVICASATDLYVVSIKD